MPKLERNSQLVEHLLLLNTLHHSGHHPSGKGEKTFARHDSGYKLKRTLLSSKFLSQFTPRRLFAHITVSGPEPAIDSWPTNCTFFKLVGRSFERKRVRDAECRFFSSL